MKRICFLYVILSGLGLLFCRTTTLYAQVGINLSGNDPDPSAMLDVVSGDKGLLIPRVPLLGSSDAVTITTPATGLLVYNPGTGGLTPAGYYYNSGTSGSPVWTKLATGVASGWSLSGNTGTDSLINYIGTADAQALIVKTNNNERLRINKVGKVGIGTSNPSSLLHVYSTSNWPTLNVQSATTNGGVLQLQSSAGLWQSHVYGATADLRFFDGYTDRVTFKNGGYVGIGTTNPSTLVDISSTSDWPTLTVQSTTTKGGILQLKSSVGLWQSYVYGPTADLRFYDGSADRITFQTGGNVGIGTTSPAFNLDVEKASGCCTVGKFGTLTPIYLQANFPGVGFNTYYNSGWKFGKGSSGNFSAVVEMHPGTGDWYVQNSGSGNADDPVSLTTRLTIKNNGRVGIGTAAPDQLLSVNGNASKTGGSSWATFSDVRLKKDVRDFKDGLSLIEKINPVYYKYNGLGGNPDDGKEYVGIIAQEVKPLAPYMFFNVSKKLSENDAVETDLIMYDASAMTYILINAIKEQQEIIKELAMKNEELKSRIDYLNSEFQEQKNELKEISSGLSLLMKQSSENNSAIVSP